MTSFSSNFIKLTMGAQSAVALTQPHVGLPTARLDGLGQLFQTQVAMTADLCRVARGLGAFDQRPAGLGMARLGKATLTPPLTTGRFRREPAQITHAWSGVLEPDEVPQFRHAGHGHGALAATQGRPGVNHRDQPPGFRRLWPCVCEMRQACRVVVDRPLAPPVGRTPREERCHPSPGPPGCPWPGAASAHRTARPGCARALSGSVSWPHRPRRAGLSAPEDRRPPLTAFAFIEISEGYQ
jgi:hypothetical protein